MAGLCCLLSACYYVQATRGQIEVLSKREPIDEVLASPETDDELGRRLRLVQEAREFSIDELGLPDNDSYRSYSDLERDFVVWNVFAAPEFSLQAREWCYPIVGCVSYRGYFSETAAREEADRLARKGFDVAVGGVPAYSTLGNFADPVLSTMMRWDDVRLVSTLFHELAHQVLYIKDDTAFNESFATAVEEIGIEPPPSGPIDIPVVPAPAQLRRHVEGQLLDHHRLSEGLLLDQLQRPIWLSHDGVFVE